MEQAIGDILTPALGVALSPFPIVAVILTLLSDRGRTNGVAFVVGWVTGLVAVVGLLLLVADRVGISGDENGPSTMTSMLQLLAGVILLLLAVRKWNSRPKEGEEPKVPGWMSMLSNTSPPVAVGLGAMMSGLNPKNLLFNLVAGAAIASSGASVGGEIVAWVMYILMASSSVLIPMIWFVVSPDSATSRLEQARIWLIQNNTIMLATLLVVIGVSQIGNAISGFGA